MPRPRSIEDDDLLPKAVRLFWRNGYLKTGVRELESALGLKAPSLYHRFGCKEALFNAALAHYIDTVVRARIGRYLEADDPLVGLREFFDTTYDYISKRKPALGCLLVNTSLELDDTSPEITAQLEHGGRLIRDALRANLLRAQCRGALRAETDLAALADCLHLGLQGLLVSSKVSRDPRALKARTDNLFAALNLTTTRKGAKS